MKSLRPRTVVRGYLAPGTINHIQGTWAIREGRDLQRAREGRHGRRETLAPNDLQVTDVRHFGDASWPRLEPAPSRSVLEPSLAVSRLLIPGQEPRTVSPKCLHTPAFRLFSISCSVPCRFRIPTVDGGSAPSSRIDAKGTGPCEHTGRSVSGA
jgi:hypothetical protein